MRSARPMIARTAACLAVGVARATATAVNAREPSSLRGCSRRILLVVKAPRSEVGHFQTKPDATSLPVDRSGPHAGADVLHLAFVLSNALGRPRVFRNTAACPSPTDLQRSDWQRPACPPAERRRVYVSCAADRSAAANHLSVHGVPHLAGTHTPVMNSTALHSD